MFSVEIEFRDGISPPETVFVRRSSALVGTSERAHVVIDGAGSGIADIQILRGLGRQFSIFNVHRSGASSGSAAEKTVPEGVFTNSTSFQYGNLSLHVTALDIDVSLPIDGTPQEGSIHAFRRALGASSKEFPAIGIVGSRPVFSSFPSDSFLVVGRSRGCGLRLDASDISAEHARFGVDTEGMWVEDLGSTNGTFVGEEKISGRRHLGVNESVRIGADFRLVPVTSHEEVSRRFKPSAEELVEETAQQASRYPCLLSESPLVRPKRVYLEKNSTITIGRDPANDVWVSASHISRQHLQVSRDDTDALLVTDCSSNGTFLNGEQLVMGEAVSVESGRILLDLCSGVEMQLVFSEQEDPQSQLISEFLELESGERIELVQEEYSARSATPEVFSKDKLNEANLYGNVASDYLSESVETGTMSRGGKAGLTEFEKYQRTQARNAVVAEDAFESPEALSAYELESEFELENSRKDFRSIVLLVLFVFLVAMLCLVIFNG